MSPWGYWGPRLGLGDPEPGGGVTMEAFTGQHFTSREEGVCVLDQRLDHAHHLDGRHRGRVQLSLVPGTEREMQRVIH